MGGGVEVRLRVRSCSFVFARMAWNWRRAAIAARIDLASRFWLEVWVVSTFWEHLTGRVYRFRYLSLFLFFRS